MYSPPPPPPPPLGRKSLQGDGIDTKLLPHYGALQVFFDVIAFCAMSNPRVATHGANSGIVRGCHVGTRCRKICDSGPNVDRPKFRFDRENIIYRIV